MVRFFTLFLPWALCSSSTIHAQEVPPNFSDFFEIEKEQASSPHKPKWPLVLIRTFEDKRQDFFSVRFNEAGDAIIASANEQDVPLEIKTGDKMVYHSVTDPKITRIILNEKGEFSAKNICRESNVYKKKGNFQQFKELAKQFSVLPMVGFFDPEEKQLLLLYCEKPRLGSASSQSPKNKDKFQQTTVEMKFSANGKSIRTLELYATLGRGRKNAKKRNDIPQFNNTLNKANEIVLSATRGPGDKPAHYCTYSHDLTSSQQILRLFTQTHQQVWEQFCQNGSYGAFAFTEEGEELYLAGGNLGLTVLETRTGQTLYGVAHPTGSFLYGGSFNLKKGYLAAAYNNHEVQLFRVPPPSFLKKNSPLSHEQKTYLAFLSEYLRNEKINKPSRKGFTEFLHEKAKQKQDIQKVDLKAAKKRTFKSFHWQERQYILALL